MQTLIWQISILFTDLLFVKKLIIIIKTSSVNVIIHNDCCLIYDYGCVQNGIMPLQLVVALESL